MKIETEYSIREKVYLVTDPDQNQRIITAISIRENGISYELACGSSSSWHYGFEISTDKNYQV